MQRILTIDNGEPRRPLFSAAEIAGRLGRLRAHMARAGLSHVVLTSIHNVNYFSGYVYCAFGRPYGLAVTAAASTLVSANIDGGEPRRRAQAGNLVYTDWQQDNFYHAVATLTAGATRVGVEDDHLPLDGRRKLGEAVGGAELVDVGRATMRLRMLKSTEEIELIRAGARVADLGGAACVEAAGEGVPEYEVALHATAAMVRAIAQAYPQVELMDTWTWFQSGINTDGAHNPVTSRRLRKGDILSLNCFPMIGGYYTALERTLFLDHASESHLRNWEINCAVHRRGLELIRPGARCCDVAHELNAIYAEHGLLGRRTFGYGHSFGTLCHYYGREAGLELREDVDTVLAPGMVVSMEPMIMLPEGEPGAGGYREHDILIVTADGAEDITGFPFGPEHNIIAA